MQDATIELLTNIVMLFLVATWVILGIGGSFGFHLWSNVAAKIRWYPRWVIFEGVLFVVIATATCVLGFRSFWSLSVLLFLVPALALIIYLSIARSPFCRKCGTMINNSNWFFGWNFCPECGAELRRKKAKPTQ